MKQLGEWHAPFPPGCPLPTPHHASLSTSVGRGLDQPHFSLPRPPDPFLQACFAPFCSYCPTLSLSSPYNNCTGFCTEYTSTGSSWISSDGKLAVSYDGGVGGWAVTATKNSQVLAYVPAAASTNTPAALPDGATWYVLNTASGLYHTDTSIEATCSNCNVAPDSNGNSYYNDLDTGTCMMVGGRGNVKSNRQ